MAVKRTVPKRAVAKKSTPTRPPKGKSASAPETEGQAVVNSIVAAIEEGQFDGFLSPIDAAVTGRMDALLDAEEALAKETATKKPADSKRVAAAPKKTAAPKVAKVTPKEKGVYMVGDALKTLVGAKVEFQRYKAGDKEKSVVVMKTDKPGNPKGKRLVIPTSALEEVPAPVGKSASRIKKPVKK
jgi:hypothetical protein